MNHNSDEWLDDQSYSQVRIEDEDSQFLSYLLMDGIQLNDSQRHQNEPSSESDNSDVVALQFWRPENFSEERSDSTIMSACKKMKKASSSKTNLECEDIQESSNALLPQIGRRKKINNNILHSLSERTLFGGYQPHVQRSILSKFLPCYPKTMAQHRHKVFCGKYCGKNGDMFMTASQDCLIRLYDTNNDIFFLRDEIAARDVGWSVLDVAVSHAGDCLVYSSWCENLHCVKIGSHVADQDKRTHFPLPLAPDDGSFCMFCVTFSEDDKEILGGSNDGCIYIYDRASDQRSHQIHAHHADVNTVCFLDENTNVLASGADDGLVKIWDRRSLRESSDGNSQPVGEMAGHVDGIAYLSSKGDGRYLISNSKDQSIKLWDLRKFSDKTTVQNGIKAVLGQRWDYRWQRVPKYVARSRGQIDGDSSVMTYTGHTVLQTLIRCHFSPMNNTGQKYIYTGCANGRVIIYDLHTGDIVSELTGHQACVRDVSWHGDQLNLVSSSWDGTVVRWSPTPNRDEEIHTEEDFAHGELGCRRRKTRNFSRSDSLENNLL